jgi:hypothetical protein
LLADHPQTGPRLRRVEANQQIAGLDMHAVMDRDFRHDTARRMLDTFDVGLHDQIARHDHGSGKRNRNHPHRSQPSDNEQHAQAVSQLLLEGAAEARRQRIGGRIAHDNCTAGEKCSSGNCKGPQSGWREPRQHGQQLSTVGERRC